MSIDDAKNVLRTRYQQVAPHLKNLKAGLGDAWSRARTTARAHPRASVGACCLLGIALIACSGDKAPEGEAAGGAAGVQDTREAAELCVEALRAGDFSKMTPLVLTSEDVRTMMEAMSSEQRARVLDKAKDKGGAEGIAAHQRERLERAFDQARREGASQFPWEDVELVSVETKLLETESDGPDVPRAEVTAILEHGGRRHELAVRQSKSPRGWVCERLRFKAP